MKRLPLYLADMKEGDKMLSLSIVAQPASHLRMKVVESDEHGVKVFAPVLPANVPIYRNNEAYGEHYVMFLPEVVTDIMIDSAKRLVPFDYEHSGTPIEGVKWVESFQIDYRHNKLYNGYRGLTDGTWCAILAFMWGNMVNGDCGRRVWPSNILEISNFGLSISGIFSYENLPLSEAVEFLRR